MSKWFAALVILSLVLLSSSQQLVSLLKLELNAASYTPVIEVLDSPLRLNAEVVNNKISSTKITKAEVVEVEIVKAEFHSQLNAQLDDPIKNINNEIQLIEALDDNQNPIIKTLNEEKSILNSEKQTLTTNNENTLGNFSSEIEKKLTSTNFTPNESLVNQPDTSPSEIAFKNTDASSPQSPSYNAYAKELLELTPSTVNSNSTTKQEHTLTVGDTDTSDTLSTPLTSEVEKSISSYNNAELIFSTYPKYPVIAKRKGIELEVKVHFVIDKDGSVKDIVFPAVKRHRNYFKSAVRNAMEKWRFIPATYNGEAVESEMAKIFSFSLHQK